MYKYIFLNNVFFEIFYNINFLTKKNQYASDLPDQLNRIVYVDEV